MNNRNKKNSRFRKIKKEDLRTVNATQNVLLETT